MYIKTFDQISEKDTPIAGGKGSSLGEMTQAGLAVPPGFVVLTNAFERFITETNLKIKVETLLKKVNLKDLSSVNKVSAKIKNLVLKEKISAPIQKEVLNHFKKLGAKFVAVRSSATAEDSNTASWAGELETYLNVTEKDLINYIKKCWSSLYTPRAIFYRFEKKLHRQNISVAVVVQKMVQSEISGISFTVHPVTKNRSQMVIEAGYGLGEAIVSGSITPDTYIVDKKNFSVLDVNISEQKFKIIKTTKGNINQKLPITEGRRRKLNSTQLIAISKICKNIERHYRKPQDIEWAFEKGKFYITQSRPITTL